MHALAIVANVLAMHTTELPLVLDGCHTASALRAAEIREMAPESPDALAAVADLLVEPDGATCLLESWVLVDLYRAQPQTEIIAHTLVASLASDKPHLAARAARLVRVLGVADAGAFLRLVHRREMTSGAWSALRNDLGAMPAGPRKEALAYALEIVAPVAVAKTEFHAQ